MQIVVVLLTMMYRNLDRMVVWLFAPHDDMLLVESESKVNLVRSFLRSQVSCPLEQVGGHSEGLELTSTLIRQSAPRVLYHGGLATSWT